MELKPEKISEVIRSQIKYYENAIIQNETGTVLTVGDGIARVSGLTNCMSGELLEFQDGTYGMEETSVSAVLFGSDVGIQEGQTAKRTGRVVSVPVGEAMIGRVVNAIGQPIDGAGPIESSEFRAVESPAPGIIKRQPVKEPLQTGIKAIASMIPIGRGQRELIIGDRQTGKTSIAVDTILNQKGKDCICVYVAIGQKESTIASLVDNLKKHDAMDYCCIMAATAADPASIQYIAPYSATSLSEYFMEKGKDVLIVYDDLSKHAVAYRALSLLLGRAPGREAYPGDVFYLHSRLLERSCRLSEEHGGGSITALPIIETLDGDVSAYIPTNVISITDGQIFLESSLFFSGQRPAVNVGLSVSRVGGAAQAKAMKKASGSLRIDLAQYREMAVFTQFSSDLDEGTKEQLAQGKILMELLKQPLGHPMSLSEQVITLVVALNKRLLFLESGEVKDYQAKLLRHFSEKYPEIGRNIEISGLLSEDSEKKILEIEEEYRKLYTKEAGKEAQLAHDAGT